MPVLSMMHAAATAFTTFRFTFANTGQRPGPPPTTTSIRLLSYRNLGGPMAPPPAGNSAGTFMADSAERTRRRIPGAQGFL